MRKRQATFLLIQCCGRSIPRPDAARALQTLYKSDPAAEGISDMTKSLSTTTLKKDAYTFITDQQGLMASLGIAGTKISRIKR